MRSIFVLPLFFLLGAAEPQQPRIRIVDTGVVYKNPAPHLRAVNALHPTLALLPQGGLLAAFDLGQGPESFDYSTYVSRCTDGGKTWSGPARVVKQPFEFNGRRCNYIIRIRELADGTIFGIGARIYRDLDDEGFVNRETFGYAPTDLVSVTSADGGRTWSEPVTIKPPIVGPSFEICHAVLELPDGRLLAPMGTWKDWKGNAPSGMKAIALVSRDRGKSWNQYIDVMDDYANGVIHFEQSMSRLRDGRLVAIAWAYNEKAGKSLPTPYVLSDAAATKFGPRMQTGLRGQTAKIAVLPDGKILCLYRRDDKPGLWANLSEIHGEEWVNLAEAPVWMGANSGMTGEKSIAEELSGLKFGFPNLRVMPDGTVTAVFWCVEAGISIVRWVRIAVAN